MKCVSFAAGVLFAVACAAEAQETQEWKVLAKVTSVGDKPPIPITLTGEQGRRVDAVAFRGPADLATAVVKDPGRAADPAEQKKAEEWAAKLLGVERIEWGKQMLIGIDAGTFTGPREVRLVSLKADGKVLTVTWDLAQRPGTGLSNPRALVLVPRFEGGVNFVRADKK